MAFTINELTAALEATLKNEQMNLDDFQSTVVYGSANNANQIQNLTLNDLRANVVGNIDTNNTDAPIFATDSELLDGEVAELGRNGHHGIEIYLFGSDEPDQIISTHGSDFIFGYGGNDEISGQ